MAPDDLDRLHCHNIRCGEGPLTIKHFSQL